jgi:hypothetical protein
MRRAWPSRRVLLLGLGADHREAVGPPRDLVLTLTLVLEKARGRPSRISSMVIRTMARVVFAHPMKGHVALRAGGRSPFPFSKTREA